VQDANTLAHFIAGRIPALQQCLETREQRLDMGFEQAVPEICQQLLEREQGMDFRRTEPETGQFVSRCPGIGCIVAVTPQRPIPDNRCMETVPQVLEVALYRGLRCPQRLDQRAHRHAAPLAQQLIDFIKAFGAVHSTPGS